MTKPKILIVDDEKPTRDAMARVLSRDYTCLTAPDAALALEAVRANPDLALLATDYRMPGDDGITLIEKARAIIPDLGCILITAFGEISLAVEAMKRGASDFLTKPISDLDQLEMRIAKALRDVPVVNAPAAEKANDAAPDGFTGSSPAMRKVYSLIRRIAPSNASVLVSGPSGTGKELVARALHALSRRSKGPFVAVNCAALSASLLESELFGYEKGAFTGADEKGRVGRFEAAQGGTLFLDEITEIDLATQVKLLRVLESRTIQRVGGNADIPVDFRLVSATNRNLAEYVAEGKFREDLFYRLNVIDIPIPALKDRPGDVALLSKRFLAEFAASNGANVTSIDDDALAALAAYDWPGNVRQLRNVIEKMVVLSSNATLTTADLPTEITAPAVSAGRGRPAPQASGEPLVPKRLQSDASTSQFPTASLAETEKAHILEALAAAGGNKSKAAEALGISRRTLHRKLNEWNLDK